MSSVFHLSQLVGRHMIERWRGEIVNVVSLLSFKAIRAGQARMATAAARLRGRGQRGGRANHMKARAGAGRFNQEASHED